MPACRLKEPVGSPWGPQGQACASALGISGPSLALTPARLMLTARRHRKKGALSHAVRSLVLHVAARVQSPWAQRYFAA